MTAAAFDDLRLPVLAAPMFLGRIPTSSSRNARRA